jgi:hypothetical protein
MPAASMSSALAQQATIELRHGGKEGNALCPPADLRSCLNLSQSR